MENPFAIRLSIPNFKNAIKSILIIFTTLTCHLSFGATVKRTEIHIFSGGTPFTWTKSSRGGVTKLLAGGTSKLYEKNAYDNEVSVLDCPLIMADCSSSWRRISTSEVTDMAAGGDILYLKSPGGIFKFQDDGKPCTTPYCPGWTQIDGSSRTIDLEAAGNNVYKRYDNGQIWGYINGQWVQLDRSSSTKAITAEGDSLYQIKTDGSIWYYTGVPCNSLTCSGWTRIGSSSQNASIVATGGSLYSRDSGNLRRCQNHPCLGSWQQIDNSTKTMVYVVSVAGTLYQMRNDSTIWRYNGGSCSGSVCTGWEKIYDNSGKSGSLSKIVGTQNKLFLLKNFY